jgi:uncharacterized membrane protein
MDHPSAGICGKLLTPIRPELTAVPIKLQICDDVSIGLHE